MKARDRMRRRECSDCGACLTRHETERCAACAYQREAWRAELEFTRADDAGEPGPDAEDDGA